MELPAPHIEARLVAANETYMLAGRGTWKTSRGIALYCIDKIYEMPGSTGVGVGLSFEHLGDNTLPPLLQAWEEFGFSHGDHYVIGKRPPKAWPKPYLGIINEKYDHVISWHNGTAISLVSLAKKASANGISAQWGFFDEVKFMKQKELQDEIFPIFRGNGKHFGHQSGYLSKFFATDKLADPVMIKWLLEKAKLVDHNKIKIVLALALELERLKDLYNSAGINLQKKIKVQIHAVESRLAKLRANMVHYVEISAYDVVYAYGERWLKDKKRNMNQHEFQVSIENKDPDKPGDAFYPAFDQKIHTHIKEYDINPAKPFILAADYQHSVSPITVAQLAKLPGHEQTSLNYLDEVYTLANPEKDPDDNGNGTQGGLKEAVQLFCERYRAHMHKVVYYVYDHTAIGKRNNADTFRDIVKKELRRNKWSVREIYTGQAPGHGSKYMDTMAWMKREDDKLPAITIHRERCPKLIISITGAPAKSKTGKTEKDKSSEQEPSLDQSTTTHFSDVFDQCNHAVIKMKLIKETTEARGMALR